MDSTTFERPEPDDIPEPEQPDTTEGIRDGEKEQEQDRDAKRKQEREAASEE